MHRAHGIQTVLLKSGCSLVVASMWNVVLAFVMQQIQATLRTIDHVGCVRSIPDLPSWFRLLLAVHRCRRVRAMCTSRH